MIYLIKESNYSISEKIIKNILKELKFDFNDLNILTFEEKLMPLYLTANAKSLFNPNRVILFKECIFFEKTSKLNKDQWEELTLFLEKFYQQNDNHIIMLTSNKIEQKNDKVKKILKYCSVREVVEFGKKEIEDLVKSYLTKLGINHVKSDIKDIVKRCDYNINIVENELKKIELLREDLTKELIKEIIPDYRNNGIWKFLDYFFKNDLEKLLNIYNHLLKQGSTEIGLLQMISKELDIMIKIEYEIKNGFSQSEIQDKLKLSSFRYFKLKEKMIHLDINQLENIIMELFEVDKTIKYGKLDANVVFKQFIIKRFQ